MQLPCREKDASKVSFIFNENNILWAHCDIWIIIIFKFVIYSFVFLLWISRMGTLRGIVPFQSAFVSYIMRIEF